MRLAILTAVLTLSSTFAFASVIVANGTPDLTQANSRGIIMFRNADDFVLGSSATIDTFRFWMLAEPGQFSGSMTYAFYQNSAGALGSLIVSGTVNSLAAVDLGQVPTYFYDYYTVDIPLLAPLVLNAGTYWLELHHGSSLTATQNTNVYWGIVNGSGGNALQSSIPLLPSGSTNNELAFSLNGTVGSVSGVPEPGTLALSLVGLAALSLSRRRKSVKVG